MLLAVMGLVAGQNLFFQNGRFEEGAYVPAYLRRYPFTLANAGEGSEAEFVVCIDRAAPGFVEEGDGQALFDNGEPTEFTRNAISFLDAFEAGRKHTQEFVDLVEQAGLFDTKNTLFVSPTGQREHVADYFGVAEDRLADLSDEVLGNLVRRGAMTAIHAHLFSLQRWNDLLARRTAGQQIPADSSAADEQDSQTPADQDNPDV